jgi:hypothetical protein
LSGIDQPGQKYSSWFARGSDGKRLWLRGDG